MSSADEKSLALFKAFHGRDPRGQELATMTIPTPMPLLQVGHAWAISYVAKDVEKKPLFHKFSSIHRPLLYVSPDGQIAFIVKGRWKFTDRGFVG
jgi:hypothetical protein